VSQHEQEKRVSPASKTSMRRKGLFRALRPGELRNHEARRTTESKELQQKWGEETEWVGCREAISIVMAEIYCSSSRRAHGHPSSQWAWDGRDGRHVGPRTGRRPLSRAKEWSNV